MTSSSRCCDGRTGEKICRVRYLIPMVILILAVQITIWKYLIAPKLFSHESLDFEGEEKSESGFSEKSYLDEDPDEDQNEIYKDDSYFSSTVLPMDEFESSTLDPVTSTEFLMESSVGNYEQKDIEKLRHRHRNHKKKKYYVEKRRLQLTEEQERRAQRIYEQQQAELRRMKEGDTRNQEEERRRKLHEESERRKSHEDDQQRRKLHEESERRRVHEEEQRRRTEHERRMKQWQEEEKRKNPSTHPPPVQQSNQWHHSDAVDPWAHLRQLHEQRGKAVVSTEVPKNHQSGADEVDPFQITKHELEEVSRGWRHHADQRRENERERHHQQHPDDSRRHHQQHSGDSRHHQHTSEDSRRHHQHASEDSRRHHQQRLEEAKRLQEESKRKEIEEEKRRNEGQQHHHHLIQGALEPMKNVHSGHHTHHRHEHGQVPPEVSNEVQPKVSKEERDLAPVIVTALIDIGRGDWHRFTRPFDLYLSYLLDLLKLQNRVIIYGDKSVVEFLQSQGDSIDPSRLQIIEVSLQDLPYYRYKQEIEGIMKNEQEHWQDSWEKATKSHPEAINPDYNILVNSKPYLLFNATQISKFDSEFFVWMDAGYSHGQKNMIPHILWNPSVPAGKITAIKLTGEQDKIKNYKIEHVYRKQWTVLSGGVLAGDPPTIDRFRRFYHKIFMDLLDSKKTDDDQTTLLLTAAGYHNLFNILTGGWFDAFKLLPNQ
ncbi:hypothetical protein FO519_006561 [Halicephalobus sp. NKZ332]|nr:hypothetical protein FO519_006561 [Halicephalobus sp. NKZ332]